MSRFEEVVNEAIDEAVLAESLKAEHLAARIAERVRDRQGGMRAEVSLAARYPETVPAPVSGKPTQEIYTLFGTAVASTAGTRTLTGVQAQGMTACPCAQELIAAGARERLAEDGYTRRRSSEILDLVPVATHNQRGIGTLYLGRSEDCETEIDARELLAIVESSMSSEIYELMKREDERCGGREGARQSPLRRGLRPRDGPPRRRAPTPTSTAATSSSPARRTSRRSTATTSSPSAPASSPRSSPSSRRASTRPAT